MISFRSSITRKVLNYFFLNPEQTLYVNELARVVSVDKRNLIKKLRELEEEEIVHSHTRGNMRFYGINKEYPLYDEYKKIVFKTVGVEDTLRSIIRLFPDIKEAYIFGSYATQTMDAHSDIDILIIGEHSIIEVSKKIRALQSQIGREINSIHMSSKEFKEKRAAGEPFLKNIFNNTHVRLQ
jgi:predicted nucleotidyltransferase